ncbi:uncharacterized protein LOC128230528 [Mya arenaria]|nr:uncharacterized protein LOC128230528 [Mya arenaria]
MANVTDLEEVVKTWAWTAFVRTRSDQYKKLKLDDISMDVNWARVRFTPTTPEYADSRMVDSPTSKVVFTSTFVNNTNKEQEHSFTTERTTVCTATTSITKGYSKGFNMELKLGLPEEVAAATVGFGRELNVENTEEQTVEKTISWSVNSNISVAEMSKAIARMEVKEKEYTGEFKLTVRVKGVVVVSILNVRDNNSFIHSCEGDISQILADAKRGGYTISGRAAVFEVAGKTKFRFGVEQQVSLDQEPL